MPEATDYERYLRTAELLELQKPAAEQLHRDELLFQVVHQSSELWLKHAAFETETAAARLRDGDLAEAARLLRRAILGLRLLTEQLEMLEHIAPRDYHLLRAALGQGSGFDSPGFRALQEAAREVGAAFLTRLRTDELDLVALYADPDRAPETYRVAELLTDWDQQLGLWRARHLKIVERLIGSEAIGTQGTPIALLRELAAQRAFPDLWAARDALARTVAATRAPHPQRPDPR